MRMAELDMDHQTIARIGHNQPPEPTVIERAEEAQVALSNYLNETPVITEGPQLVRAKQLVEHARGVDRQDKVPRCLGGVAPVPHRVRREGPRVQG